MRFTNLKTILSLLLAVALLAGLLSGCQLAQIDPSTATAEIPSGESISPTQPSAPKEYIGVFPPDWIPPDLKDAWEKGLFASPDDTYYTADLQWAVDSIQLPDACAKMLHI